MAGPEGSRYYNIFLNYKVWLETRKEEVVISAEGFELLLRVAEMKSIVSAAAAMKISYRKAWGLLREIEDLIGFKLIEKHRGGASGGKTVLTSEGLDLIDAYNDLNAEIDVALKDIARKFFWRINDIAEKV